MSSESVSVCVVDASGRIVRKAKVASEPELSDENAGVPVRYIGFDLNDAIVFGCCIGISWNAPRSHALPAGRAGARMTRFSAIRGETTPVFELYADAPVFIYHSVEPRHIHYSPIEAMVVGTPVLYRRGALADTLAGGADLPGACATTAEMHSKARRLLAGDRDLAEDIRMSQGRIVDTFATDLARRQWAEVLDHEP